MAYDEAHDQEIVTVRLPKSVIAAIDRRGKEEDRSRSYLIRDIVTAAVEDWATKRIGKK